MTTVQISELDETLVTLGLLVGFLKQSDAEKDANEVGIQTEWFEDPLGEIKNITSGGNDRLFDLIGAVFPKDGAENGDTKQQGDEEWHAITYPDDKGESKKTPLNLVRKWQKRAGDRVTKDVIGLGCKGEYGTSVVVRPYLFVPVADRGEFVVGRSAHPIEAGVEIKRGAGASEKLGTNAIRFSGLRLSVKIHLDRAPEISDIMLFGLEMADGVTLPGLEEDKSEIGLIEIFEDAPGKLDEWMEFVFELILTEISDEDAGSLGTTLNNLRLLLGLSKKGPGKVPSIDWGDLTSRPDEAFKKWFAQIFFDDASRKTWLNALQCLLDGEDATKDENQDRIGGNGSVKDPYALSVLSSWGGSSFNITFATDGSANGKKRLSVGLRLQSELYELAHGIGVQFLAAVDAAQFPISQNDIKIDGVLREFDLSVRACNPAAATRDSLPLFRYTPHPRLPPLPGAPETKPPPDTRLNLGALQAGVKVSLSGGVQTPVPSLYLTGVTLGDDEFDINLLTLQKTPTGAAKTAESTTENVSKENVRELLNVLGSALQDAWDRYQPSRYASLETNVERIIQGDDYKSIIDKLLQMSGKEVADIPALLVELGEWIAEAEPKELPQQAFNWLLGDGNVFGLLGELLSLQIPEFSGEGSLLSYAPWHDFTISIGKDSDSNGAATKTGPFGIWMRPRAGLDAVSLSGQAAVIFENGFSDPPAVTATARIGLGDAPLVSLKKVGFDVNPELAVRLGSNASSFSVDLYPLGSSADDAFLMALLPDPLAAPYLAYKNEPRKAVAADQWMLRLVPRVLVPFFEEKLLNDDGVIKILEEAPLGGEFTAATVLVDWGVLSRDDQHKYRLAKFDALSELTAAGLLKSVVTGFQNSGADARLVAIGSNGDGIYFVFQKGPNETYTDFGLRLRITDIEFGGKKQGSKKKPQKSQRSPKATPKLQLGKWMRDEAQTKSSENWLASSSESGVPTTPGLTVNLLRLDREQEPSFQFALELISVGLDIEGGQGKPLLDKNGYQLQGLQSRLYFAWSKDGGDPKFGAAVQLKEMGIPLGPKTGGDSAKSNPVAGNLLASGDGAKGKEDEAVNPTFSGVVAYVDKFYGKIFSDIPSADGKAWIPVSRNFGPLHCRQIGLGLDSEKAEGPWLGIGYDGGVALGPLNIDLDHLTIDIPLKHPQQFSQYKLGLAGLDISYAGGPISISGGFFKNEVTIEGRTTTQYDGMALIKAADFTITGFGSYAVVAGDPSLFVFAILHKDLGGPAFFHVTGLAAGFGYNRALKLLPIEEVHNFPLVCAALDEKYLAAGENAIQTAMEKLRDYIPPSRGEYWFAAGVRFSSFEMIESFALLSVSLGKGVEIGLLGMSKLTLPKGAKQADAVVYAELAIKAVINPDQGIISVEGRLTDKSFIFSKDCRLTGGFAFYIWFAGQHAGDFVLTLGGYHSKFVRPDHYPVVPRLEVNWQVNPVLTVTAELYFAITPSCLMAGGKLRAVYKVACIKAWFTAYADFLLNWQPFYYLVDMGISIGVEATVRIPLGFATITISIRVELSVDLHLWGPPFAGEARVDLSVISFTIPFGDPKSAPLPLTADAFVNAFLPAPQEHPEIPDVIGVRINSGLLQQREKDKQVVRVVNAHTLSLTAESLIPSTRFAGLATIAKYKQPGKRRPDLNTGFGIRPMAKQRLTSAFEVRLLKKFENDFVDQDTPSNLQISFVENGVPDALWGPSQVEGQVALPSEPQAITIDATVGVRFSFAPIPPKHAIFPIPLEKLKFEQLPTKKVVWQDLGEARTIAAHEKNTFWNTIWGNPDVNHRRDAILDVLRGQSPFALNVPNLEQLHRSERDYFQADPEFCTLGEQLK